MNVSTGIVDAEQVPPRAPDWGRRHGSRARAWIGFCSVLGLAICGALWAYWPTLTGMIARWSSDPQYSHGFFVPLCAIAILWSRRSAVERSPNGGRAWGIGLLVLAGVFRLLGASLFIGWLDEISLVPALAGFTLVLGGWGALTWAGPAIAFLVFMVPLPFQLDTALARPLQSVATAASTYALQTIGLPAVSEGNIIVLENVRIGVVEACSGLGMLMSFFALSTAAALIVRRVWVVKLTLALSAIPIAIFANVSRITLTGVLHETVGERLANIVFHDLAGWLMMPLAAILLWLEFDFLDRLLVPRAAVAAPVLGPGPPATAAVLLSASPVPR